MMAAATIMMPTKRPFATYASRQPNPAYNTQTIVMRMTIQFRFTITRMRLRGRIRAGIRRQGLKNTSAATRKRITTADPHDLDVIEWSIRRQYDAISVTHSHGCSVVRHGNTSSSTALYTVYQGRYGQSRLFFDPPTPKGSIRRSFLNPVEWMRDDRPDLSYPSADDALAALLVA